MKDELRSLEGHELLSCVSSQSLGCRTLVTEILEKTKAGVRK